MSKTKQKSSKKKKRKSPESQGKNKKKANSNNHFSRDIPVFDFLKENDIDTEMGLGQCLEIFIFFLSNGYFNLWEAVMKKEQGLILTEKQQEILTELFNFNDEEMDQILYIDDLPRPSEPWYEILRKIAPKLILEPFETFEIYNEIYHNGWVELVECLEDYANDLSLPQGIASPVEVVPRTIRHRLSLQYYCFDTLSGLGQDEELTLSDEEQKIWRIKKFIDSLKENKESIEYFDLSLEELLELVKLGPIDRNILIDSVLKELKLHSPSEKLAIAL